MAFCHHRGCELRLDTDTQRVFGFTHACRGPIEFAHLSDLKRYDVGDIGAGLCQDAHRGFDGRVGGKAAWYVALSKDGQKGVRQRLSSRARMAWDALPQEARVAWDEVGRNRFARRAA